MTRVINLNKVVPESVVIEYGDLKLDVTSISAYHAIKLMEYGEKHKKGVAGPSEAIDIVLDVLREKNPDVTEEDVLKAGSFADLLNLIQTVNEEIMSVKASGVVTGPLDNQTLAM